MDSGILLHSRDNVHCLECDAFKSRSGDVCRRGSTGYSEYPAFSILIPVRSTKSRQRRHHIDSTIVRYRGRKSLNHRGTLDDSKAVTQPLNDRAGNEYRPFKGIVHLVADLPRDGGEKVVLRHYRLLTCVHQQETTCAVSVLDGSRLGAHLTEQSGLLVTGYSRDRNVSA